MVRVSENSCLMGMKIKEIMCFRPAHFRSKDIDCFGYTYKAKPIILQIPQDLNREKTFEDNTITDRKERAKIFGQYDHVRIYGRDYFDKLRSIGFTVIDEDYTQKITPELVDKYRLASGEIIPICYK
jgi:hypothetical protein